jgi:hypothetical protein
LLQNGKKDGPLRLGDEKNPSPQGELRLGRIREDD